jgi:Nidogen-like
MCISARLARVATAVAVFASLSFGSAIVPGFNTTSDGRNDDGTYTTGGCTNPADGGTCAGTLVPIGFNVNFYGLTTNALYINTNGNITFDSPLATSTPFSLVDGFNEIIAPFFADVDTRSPASGVVSFGNGTFVGEQAFGVNWPNVGYFDQETDHLDDFQLLLVNRSDTGAGNFDIVFNYNSIQWETGDDSFGTDGQGGISAVVGFSDGSGDPANSFELPGSSAPGSFLDGGPLTLNANSLNSNIAGQYIFDFRGGNYVTTPEPGTAILMVAGLAVVVFYGVFYRRIRHVVRHLLYF